MIRTLAASLVSLSCLMGMALAGPPTYDIRQLQPLPAIFPITVVHDLSNTGEAVGRVWKEEQVGVQNHHAVLWNEDGSASDIGDNGTWSEARAISEAGFIAGRHDVGQSLRGALWTAEGRQVLPPLPGQPASEAYGVDDQGIAVGVSLISTTDVTAVRWVEGIAEVLPGANGTSWAFAVNASGQAVGRRDAWPAREAMLWEGDAFTVLPDLGSKFASATNISDNGTICGGSLDAQSRLQAVLWQPPTFAIEVLPHPGFGVIPLVKDVNDQGVAVGAVCLSSECELTNERALIWTDDGVYNLNDLIPAGSGYTLFSAEAINERGEIVCVGAGEGLFSPRGFKLTPRTTSSAPLRAEATLSFSPNPTGGEGEIRWRNEIPGSVTLAVFDASGRKVGGRWFSSVPVGVARASWSSLFGSRLAGGTYYVALTLADGSLKRTRVTLRR
jgi:uncharacterized membrane protein